GAIPHRLIILEEQGGVSIDLSSDHIHLHLSATAQSILRSRRINLHLENPSARLLEIVDRSAIAIGIGHGNGVLLLVKIFTIRSLDGNLGYIDERVFVGKIHV